MKHLQCSGWTYAFTGCNTVRLFAGRGKLSAFKQMKANTNFQEAFGQLGQSWDVSVDLFQKLQEITCCIYVSSTHTSSVNELHYQMFCARRGEVESSPSTM